MTITGQEIYALACVAVLLAYMLGVYRGRHLESFNAERGFDDAGKEMIAAWQQTIRSYSNEIDHLRMLVDRSTIPPLPDEGDDE